VGVFVSVKLEVDTYILYDIVSVSQLGLCLLTKLYSLSVNVNMGGS